MMGNLMNISILGSALESRFLVTNQHMYDFMRAVRGELECGDQFLSNPEID